MPSYILVIRYPQNVQEYLNMLEKRRILGNVAGSTDLQLLSSPEFIAQLGSNSAWSCPNENFENGDYVFFYCTASSRGKPYSIRKNILLKGLNGYQYVNHPQENYDQWLTRDREIIKKIYGKFFAYGQLAIGNGFLVNSINHVTHFQPNFFTHVNHIFRIRNANLVDDDLHKQDGILPNLIGFHPLQGESHHIINEDQRETLLTAINNYQL